MSPTSTKALTAPFEGKGISLLTNGDAYGGKLGGAIRGLDAAVVAFHDEAVMCDSRRLGQVGKHVAHTRVAVEDTATKLDCEKTTTRSAWYCVLRAC